MPSGEIAASSIYFARGIESTTTAAREVAVWAAMVGTTSSPQRKQERIRCLKIMVEEYTATATSGCLVEKVASDRRFQKGSALTGSLKRGIGLLESGKAPVSWCP